MTPGIKKAIAVANHALREVAAYRRFVAAHGVKIKTLAEERDFLALPVTDKTGYIRRADTFELFAKNLQPSSAHASSGSSGSPTFWFRSQKQIEAGGKLHEKIFRDVFKISKDEPTLVIVGFSMGIWVAGNFTQASCEQVSRAGYRLTTITPGIEKHDILHILEKLAPQFTNVVLAGYPSFVMDVLTEAKTKQITLPERLRLLTSGDSFSEDWRDAVRKLLGIHTTPSSVLSVYGSADAAAMAFETPLSVFVRRASLTHPALKKALFNDDEKLPMLMQFDPSHIYFETVNGELVVTADTAIPLVRYNVHDRGQVVDFGGMKKILAETGLLAAAREHGLDQWRWPFVIKTGRTDVAVTFYALNIYPEHIQIGLNDKKISAFVSGNFRAYNKTLKNHSHEQLCFEIELAENKAASKKLLQKVTETLTDNLLKVNTEFRKLHATLGSRARPYVKLTNKLNNLTVPRTKILLGIKGKKAKIITQP